MLRIFFAFFSWPLFVLAAESLPTDAQQALESLPDKSLTVEFVLARAIGKSDSFRIVAADQLTLQSPEREAKAAFDTQLKLSTSWLDDRREPGIPAMSPSATIAHGTSLSLSKRFKTGTSLALELSDGRNEIDFPGGSFITDQIYYESKATLTLSQNLWADTFGYASRRQLEAGRTLAKAKRAEFYANIESWTLSMIDAYYGAWLAQAQVAAARSGLERRERLLKSTRLNLRRGTAEESDFLHVEAAHRFSKIQKDLAEKNLADQWRTLVLNLQLPGEWAMLDAYLIPMKIDQIYVTADKVCTDFRKGGVPDKEHPTVQAARLAKDAAQLNFEKTKNEVWPDLKLFGQVGFNGIASRSGDSWQETQDQDHPLWSVGLEVIYPLEQNLQKLKVSEAASQKLRSEAVHRQQVSQHQVSWLNECSNLSRLKTSRADAEKAFQNQVRRVNLEERRFRLGRTTVFNLIQAGDDATEAEMSLRKTEVEYRQSAWRVLQLSSRIRGELDSILKKYGERGLQL